MRKSLQNSKQFSKLKADLKKLLESMLNEKDIESQIAYGQRITGEVTHFLANNLHLNLSQDWLDFLANSATLSFWGSGNLYKCWLDKVDLQRMLAKLGKKTKDYAELKIIPKHTHYEFVVQKITDVFMNYLLNRKIKEVSFFKENRQEKISPKQIPNVVRDLGRWKNYTITTSEPDPIMNICSEDEIHFRGSAAFTKEFYKNFKQKLGKEAKLSLLY